MSKTTDIEIIQNAKIIFNNKEECIKEKNKQKALNIDGPAFIIKNKDEIEKYIYPRIEEFHKKENINIIFQIVIFLRKIVINYFLIKN